MLILSRISSPVCDDFQKDNPSKHPTAFSPTTHPHMLASEWDDLKDRFFGGKRNSEDGKNCQSSSDCSETFMKKLCAGRLPAAREGFPAPSMELMHTESAYD